MKFFLLGVFVLFFVIMPMYLLNVLVMPQLMAMKQAYSQADSIAQKVVSQPQRQ